MDSEIDSFEGSPRLKYYLRYNNPFAQAKAELEFMGRKQKCRDQLEALKKDITQGRINGLRELMLLAHDATKLLNCIAEADSDLAAVVAEHYNTWPVLWGGRSFSKNQKDLLTKIHLGSTRPDIVSRNRIGQDPPLPRRWALLLLKFIGILRSLKGVKDHPPGSWGLAENVMELEIPTEDSVAGDTAYLHPQKIQILEILKRNPALATKATKMKSFSPESAPHWWGLAETLLRDITGGDFTNFPGLAAYANTKRVSTLRRSTRTQWSEVVKAIKPAFLKLAEPATASNP